MDIFTHLLMGTLPCFLLLGKVCPEAIILLWVMAFFPDLDVFLEPIQKIRKMYFLSHKAASHSYVIGFIFTGIVSLIISGIRSVTFLELWIAGFIGYSIHVSLDFFTASKVPIFYPLSKKEFRIIADRAINPILGLFSGINLLVLLTSYYVNPDYYFFMNITYFYLIIYLSLFGIRTVLRIIVQIRSPRGSHYIPGFLLYNYLVLENQVSEGITTFKLTKHSIFSKKKTEILKQQISNDSIEMIFYDKAREVSRDYRFFHKWNAIIPFFQEDNEFIKVVLILAESYSRMSSHFLSIIFNKNTKQIVSKVNGFGSFKKWENRKIE